MTGPARAQVARACHELRGPLTAIRLGLTLPDVAAGLPPGLARAIETELDRAAVALGDLEAVAGETPSARRAFDAVAVGDVVDDAVIAAQGRAASAGVPVTGGWEGIDVIVIGDRARLAQALGNLVANAVEHGGGSVRVRGRHHGDAARIEVSDSGPGLPATIAELLARPRRDRGRRGHGLSVVEEIARDHGGRVESAPASQGAAVVLALPVALAPGD